MHILNDYNKKNSFLSLQGINHADLLIYYPIHDKFMDLGNRVEELRKELRFYGHLSDYDLINDEGLLNSTSVEVNPKVSQKAFQVNKHQYKLLILYNTKCIPLKTAKNLTWRFGNISFSFSLIDAPLHLYTQN
jgi:hypothetical protein